MDPQKVEGHSAPLMEKAQKAAPQAETAGLQREFQSDQNAIVSKCPQPAGTLRDVQ